MGKETLPPQPEPEPDAEFQEDEQQRGAAMGSTASLFGNIVTTAGDELRKIAASRKEEDEG